MPLKIQSHVIVKKKKKKELQEVSTIYNHYTCMREI